MHWPTTTLAINLTHAKQIQLNLFGSLTMCGCPEGHAVDPVGGMSVAMVARWLAILDASSHQ